MIKKFFKQNFFVDKEELTSKKVKNERVLNISKELKKFNDTFYFTLDDTLITAPKILRGIDNNGNIIIIVGMRVWT